MTEYLVNLSYDLDSTYTQNGMWDCLQDILKNKGFKVDGNLPQTTVLKKEISSNPRLALNQTKTKFLEAIDEVREQYGEIEYSKLLLTCHNEVDND